MRKLFCLFVMMNMLPFLTAIDSVPKMSDAVASYVSPEGILFVSDTKEWDETKLRELYHDLLKNTHGKELNTLREVSMEKRKKTKNGYHILGYYYPSEKKISILNAAERTTIQSVSNTLSHEYGHHFTFHYIKDLYSVNTKWAQIRSLSSFPVRWKENDLPDAHQWNPSEILAEDYVYLYGKKEKIKIPQTSEVEEVNLMNALSSDEVYPIENVFIPQPGAIKGLVDFWEEKSGLSVPGHYLLKKPELQEKKVTYLENVWLNKYKYEFTFSSAATHKNHDLLYFYEIGWVLDNKLYGKIKGVKKGKGKEPVVIRTGEYKLYNFYGQTTFLGGKMLVQVSAVDPETSILISSSPFAFKIDKETGELHPMDYHKKEFVHLPLTFLTR